jgi:low affinity Fe/Cu permease
MNAIEQPDRRNARRRERTELRSGQSRGSRHLGDDYPLGRRRPHRSFSSHTLHRLGHWTSRAAAGVTAAGIVATWWAIGIWAGFPRWWETALYSTTSSVTVVMVFAIQHTQSREQLVTQRKLDELLRAQPEADDHLIAAEVASDEELDALATQNSDDRRMAKAGDVEPPQRGGPATDY